MKLGTLKAAIRATKGNPVIETRLWSDGPMMSLALQKAVLLEQLDAAYPGGKAVETDLIFDEASGILRPDGGVVAQRDSGFSPALASAQMGGGHPGPLLDIMEDADHDLLGEDKPMSAFVGTSFDDLFV
jgi:hypothetical protein